MVSSLAQPYPGPRHTKGANAIDVERMAVLRGHLEVKV
jgi:hypothetical protein